MKIKRFVIGDLRTNCYIIIKNKDCLIIDPAGDSKRIKEETKGLTVREILVTHHHFDHIGALEELEEYYHLKHNTFTKFFPYEIIKTPGHTSDSLTFYFPKEKIMFSGDFLFKNTIGRWDLDTGSIESMQESLKKIATYPIEITIYPGHGPSTTLREEIPFFNLYFQ